MYSKKYILKKIEEFGRHNTLYDDVESSVCYPAYLKVGERGWFLCEREEEIWPHRIHTSIIKDVQYLEDQITVTTENTKFVFAALERLI